MHTVSAAFSPVSVAEDSRVWDVTVFGQDNWNDYSAVTVRVRQSKKDKDEGTVLLQNIRNCLPKLQCPRSIESTSV